MAGISLPYDWLLLALRLAFVALIYLFLWQVLRITLRELRQAAVAPPRRGRSTRAKLVVIDPAESALQPGTSFSVGPRSTTVGRRPDCAIVIDEPFLSALHAQIESRNHAWYVIDHDSTNGTFVNGRQVTGSTYIEDADVVQFGRIKLQFVAS